MALFKGPEWLKLELLEGETIIKEGLVGRRIGGVETRARLWVTDQRLVYKDLVLRDREPRIFPLGTITWVGNVRYLPTIFMMAVRFSDGSEERFRTDLDQRKKWPAAIAGAVEQATGRSISPSTSAKSAPAAQKSSRSPFWIALAVILGMGCLGGACLVAMYLLAVWSQT